ncbi:DEAD/DEAH box helicase [Corynebacterium heidelbergense]|uniref:DEAD/DEAH box helicase n=1 Tax=Corynebacterium heidelbergense TaxID=2055947 RepID=A0A364VA08_9CORY|nr:DEAD/DEAH box helicase [Corynebacterium heidelbergense]RAV33475.1 DEAD/DEAH box helicase [Corynebacterium heidelbergense]
MTAVVFHTMNPNAANLGTELLQELTEALPRSTCTHVRHDPARRSTTADWPEWVHPELVSYLQEQGVSAPWAHQVEAADAAWQGRDVIVATGTASGKSLGYQLPILSAMAPAAPTAPPPTALYLCPTKALAQDQCAALARMCRGVPALNDVMVATYDGDTPTEHRRAIRDQARIVVSNPDMVHASMLGQSARWGRFLRGLRFVVIDECHAYRGIFGAHVAMVLRRLLRLSADPASPQSGPVLILASATSVDPAEHARRLTGRSHIHAGTSDASPAGQRTIALWEPGFLPDSTGEHGAPVRRAANTEAAEIMGRIIAQGARTISFVRSRRGAELVALGAAQQLSAMGRAGDAQRVAAYRAGYTAEDRRDLERRLDDGDLLGVAATSALELGIDVGGLDAVISSGFPGTIASFRQQSGRAGRRGQGALVVLVGADDPMDTYLVHHPEALLDRPVENTVFDPRNPYVQADHVVCAAAERPLGEAEVAQWGAEETVAGLIAAGVLRRRPRGIFANATAAEQAHAHVQIRGGAADQVAIVEHDSARLLGTVDLGRAVGDVHTGAVYVHQGETFVVDSLDLAEKVAWVRAECPEYTTAARRETDIEVLGAPRRTHQVTAGVWLADVDVAVTHTVTGYIKRLPGGEVLETVPLDMPPSTLETRAVAYTVDPDVLLDLGLVEPTWPGTLHAAEHAAIGLLPLIATCDRWDIGGVSTVNHPDTGLPTVFVYDGYAGGAGFAEAGFERFSRWMRATAEAVGGCECDAGCPSCVQSPKCGNGNDPLFKRGALELLRFLAGQAGPAAAAAR